MSTEYGVYSLDAETLYEDDTRSIALVVVRGFGKSVRNNTSTMTYEVTSGFGIFTTDDRPQIILEGMSITVPEGVIYSHGGDLFMLATAEPPFDRRSIDIIEG